MVETADVGKDLDGASHSRRQYVHERSGVTREILQECEKLVASDLHQLGGLAGGDCGRAATPVEYGDLAEDVARSEGVQQDLTRRGGDEDAHESGDHDKQRISRIAFAKDYSVRAERLPRGEGCKLIQFLWCEG